jgi:acetyl-CoA carboxylase carboxyl transferase subunit alpha
MSQAVYKRTDKRADEHAYKRTGERADEHAYKRTGERADEHAYKRTDARAYKHVYERVKLARDSKRPTGLDYIKNIFNGFIEFHGDRRYADDPAVAGGIAKLGNVPVTVIAIEKGHTAKERTYRNFGMPKPEGYRKALRLMKQAEKFGRPVICFVDTSGAYCGIGAEERGQGQAIAENLSEMSTLCVPIISILIGEGGSGGALALAAADRVWMLQNAVYSVISPEGCASILWKDSSKADAAAASLKLTAEDGKSLGVIERILSEDDIGTKEFYDRIRTLLTEELKELSRDVELTQNRYDRFRKLGAAAVIRE